MRFLLYNIRYGTGGKQGHSLWRYAASTRRHLPLIIRYIEDLDPDVIGLIEVDAGSYRAGGKNQAAQISHALGHHHAYESKYHSDSFTRWVPVLRRQGNAFIARDTITNAKTHYFRKGMKRLVLELELDPVCFFLVHLALGARTRHHQLGDLYDLVKNTPKPCIVAGDFNTMWGEQEIRLFKAATGLRNADTENRPTWPSWDPSRHLDFILCSPDIRVHRLQIPRIMLSDHLPLICDFDVAASSPSPAKTSGNRPA